MPVVIGENNFKNYQGLSFHTMLELYLLQTTSNKMNKDKDKGWYKRDCGVITHVLEKLISWPSHHVGPKNKCSSACHITLQQFTYAILTNHMLNQKPSEHQTTCHINLLIIDINSSLSLHITNRVVTHTKI